MQTIDSASASSFPSISSSATGPTMSKSACKVRREGCKGEGGRGSDRKVRWRGCRMERVGLPVEWPSRCVGVPALHPPWGSPA